MESTDVPAAATVRQPRPIRILELRSVRGTGGGPEKTILLGTAQTDPDRFDVTVCYLRDARDTEFNLAARAKGLNINYLEIEERHSFDWRIWPQLARLVQSRSIDIVHAHDYKTDFLAMILSRAQGIVAMATVHGWIRNTWRERFYNRADLHLLARFPAVIAVSGPIKALLVRHGVPPDRVHQIPNGVDHRLFRKNPDARARVRRELGIADDAIVLGAVGRLSREKRFDLLLEATAMLDHLRPTLVLVGDGPERSNLSARITALGLEGRAILTGQRSDVSDLVQALDFYVQTSDTEGIPNAVLEAMAAEVPVIATDVGGTSELIEHEVHGLLVPAGDAASISRALASAIADPGATARRVAAARARIERELSFDARMSKVEAIYHVLFERAQARRQGVV